ncbi:formylglycine-generating enzyme family protein [uncultured Thiodictyon sp.]|uniref:formylglycine-generating enzyme family protein n=1 Tax=uncultured Thiodictyon sp. TaxID=1846217 RepID=UPI0025F5B734|nr:formylglycine-generating enzyme family protein [uncultured Thiodictyon sp.]
MERTQDRGGWRWWWPTALAAGLSVLGLALWYQWWGGTSTLHPPMVPIPAGSFSMGCQPADRGCYDDENPAHQVQVPAFEIGKYEVTFDEWDACVAERRCTHKPDDERWGRGSRPVINVSWDDAQQYVAWLGRKTGKPYRLPSEAEWEYAARAGTRTAWSFGDDEQALGDYAWFDANAGGKTHPVGEKRPNPWGLYDVHGNVWEWVQDKGHGSYQGAPADGRPWDDVSGAGRVARGGGWIGSGRYVRSACRSGNVSGVRDLNVGFRLALGPQPGQASRAYLLW